MECMRIMATEFGCPDCGNETFKDGIYEDQEGWTHPVLQCDQCEYIISTSAEKYQTEKIQDSRFKIGG